MGPSPAVTVVWSVRIITFKLDNEMLSRLDSVASELGLSRSEVIRIAIVVYLNKRIGGRARIRRVLLA